MTLRCMVTALFFAGILFVACRHDVPNSTDIELLQLATAPGGFTWYKLSDQLLVKGSGSGHREPLLRTRYNEIAAEQLDTVTGKVRDDAVFRTGSMIVKELYNSPGELSIYAIMYKMPGHVYADKYGWVWSYLQKNGSVKQSSSTRGEGCNGCHSQPGSIDFTLMNSRHP